MQSEESSSLSSWLSWRALNNSEGGLMKITRLHLTRNFDEVLRKKCWKKKFCWVDREKQSVNLHLFYSVNKGTLNWRAFLRRPQAESLFFILFSLWGYFDQSDSIWQAPIQSEAPTTNIHSFLEILLKCAQNAFFFLRSIEDRLWGGANNFSRLSPLCTVLSGARNGQELRSFDM